VDNRSLVERLYNWTGMKYDGLLDWGDFTDEKILYPANDFWTNLNINKKDRYVYFQWHSSGHTKNINPRENIKIIKHIIKNYGYKVYVVGRLKCLDILNEIPGVVNLSGKTEGKAESLFTLAFNSEFIVTGDSAGLHLSEAYKIPSVCIMATLPPVYVASKYKIPSFMFGSGHCPYSPCGIVHHLPKETKCPKDTGDYCKVFDNIDLNLFDRCVKQSFKNRLNYRKEEPLNFYEALKSPISLEMV
jgi:ADP-heptose:LPS heptosyltransferase